MRSAWLVSALVGTALVVLVPVAAQGSNGGWRHHAACSAPPVGFAHCQAIVDVDAQGDPVSSATPGGLAPASIESAYGFPTGSSAGAGKTIAIVDAYDDPYAEADLGVFSSQFGLPPCTTANGCFTKVNQTGGTSYPRADQGWGLEISLDIQWAHAIAPGAHVLLVEASSNSFANLLTAEDYAKAHAQYVSNSWSGAEFSSESADDSHFVQSGVSFFASSGDNGLPAEYPSASPNVISVGGTTLHFDGSGNFTGETGWADGGGGCSLFEYATSAQSSFGGYSQTNCGGKRATPDVSLDADPNSGVSVYDSYGYGGWIIVGGTSAAAPMWAARSAVAGAVVNAAYVYGNSIPFRDITSGNNGASCLVGFDLCTGRGSWADSGSGSGTTTPDFTLSAGPSSQTVTQGSKASYTVTIGDENGFNGSVQLAASGLPSGAGASFNPQPASASSTLTVTTAANTPVGTYTVTITGTSGSLVHSTTVSLTVGSSSQGSNFSLSVSPSSRSVARGSSTTYTVTISPAGGPVSLSLSGLPTNASYSFGPNPTSSGSSTLTVRTTRPRVGGTGTFTLTITGVSGGVSHTATVTLVIT